MNRSIPLGAGLGLKPQHLDEALAARAPGLWFEVHAENHMVDGGPRLAWLQAVRAQHPVSLHGVGLSLASDCPPDTAHLQRLVRLVQQVSPVLVSEHLAWSVWRGQYAPDLLPFPRSHAALQRVCQNIDQLQQALGRRIAVENPSHCLVLPGHDWPEPEFLAELVRRTGCGLLVDVNNLFVSAHNGAYAALDYLDRLPVDAVMEVHLAGHDSDNTPGSTLLVDTHGQPVAEPVWTLYQQLLARTGPRPTLIERDNQVPAFAALMAERSRAQALLDQAEGQTSPADAPLGISWMVSTAGPAAAANPAPTPALLDTSLQRFQDSFLRALPPLTEAESSPRPMPAWAQQPGFAVYRNTVHAACLDTLQANYPSVDRLVGAEWFRAAAAVFVRHQPPEDPRLMDYGAGFADFLQQFAPAASLPYLADVARLDRCWTRSHLAADGPLACAETLAAASPSDLAALCLPPHPSAHWAWSDHHPVFTLWQLNRFAQAADAFSVLDDAENWQAEGALLTRVDQGVQACRVNAASIVFLDHCAAGHSVERAVNAVLLLQPDTDLAALLAGLLQAGALGPPRRV